jgi:hypothetical protein
MSNFRFTGLLAVCAVLAACSDSPTSSARPSFDVSATDDAIAARTVDPATAEQVEPTQAATGGKASGHADALTFGGAFRDTYSFIALSVSPMPGAPFAAKGEFEGGFTNVTGTTDVRVHADVNCLRILAGNQAWVSGPVEKLIINGQQQPTTLHVLVRVVDLGEGANEPPDLISFISFTGNQGCQLLIPLALVPNERGNIQVKQN